MRPTPLYSSRLQPLAGKQQPPQLQSGYVAVHPRICVLATPCRKQQPPQQRRETGTPLRRWGLQPLAGNNNPRNRGSLHAFARWMLPCNPSRGTTATATFPARWLRLILAGLQPLVGNNTHCNRTRPTRNKWASFPYNPRGEQHHYTRCRKLLHALTISRGKQCPLQRLKPVKQSLQPLSCNPSWGTTPAATLRPTCFFQNHSQPLMGNNTHCNPQLPGQRQAPLLFATLHGAQHPLQRRGRLLIPVAP